MIDRGNEIGGEGNVITITYRTCTRPDRLMLCLAVLNISYQFCGPGMDYCPQGADSTTSVYLYLSPLDPIIQHSILISNVDRATRSQIRSFGRSGLVL